MTTKCKECHLPSFLQHYAISGHKFLNNIVSASKTLIYHHTAGMKHPGYTTEEVEDYEICQKSDGHCALSS
jgi:hypothetical protein